MSASTHTWGFLKLGGTLFEGPFKGVLFYLGYKGGTTGDLLTFGQHSTFYFSETLVALKP